MMMGVSKMTAGKMDAGEVEGMVEEDPVAKAHAMQLMGQSMDGSAEVREELKRRTYIEVLQGRQGAFPWLLTLIPPPFLFCSCPSSQLISPLISFLMTEADGG
jgi:hypothetical protein